MMITHATILLVEDNPQAAKLFSLYLRQAGYRVEVVGDGELVLPVAAGTRPQAIVLDLLLPGLDGWEVLALLKATPETRDIPVVIVSVLDRQRLGFELGAVDYLVKPVDRGQLLRAVQRGLLSRERTGWVPRVLVVCDDPQELTALGDLVAGYGYDVFEALGGGEASCLFHSLRLDLVVVGTSDGCMDVPDLLGAGLPGVPVLVAAGRTRRQVRRDTVAALGVPVEERLLDTMSRLLALHRPRDG